MSAVTLKRVVQAVNPLIKVKGSIVKGYQRGRQLGWPTANLSPNVFVHVPLENGVYFGWASISSRPDEVFKAVLSIGYNPTFGNTNKSLEVYLCHTFEQDFYEDEMRLIISGYLRPQVNIPWDDLIAAIAEDVRVSEAALNEDFYVQTKDVEFLTCSN